jgi:hypothetical protein
VRFRFFRPPVEPELSKDGPDPRRDRLFSIPRYQTRGDSMDRPAEDKIRKRAYDLWEQNGKPDGSEERFWQQAQLELQGEMDRGDPAHGSPDDI